MTEEQATDHSPGAADAGQPEPAAKRKRWRPYARFVRPRLRQIWLNIQIWIPFLINPFERRRLVKLSDDEGRHDLEWEVELPRQCWKTGQRAGLQACRFERRYRSFDRPLAIFGVMFLALMVVSTLSCLLGPYLTPTLYLTILVLGLGVLWIKSWRERVRLTLWSLPQHSADAQMPDLAIYNDQMYLYLPSVDLARAMSLELRTQRDERRRHGDPRDANDDFADPLR